MTVIPPPSADVERVFNSYPNNVRSKLFAVRNLIFKTATSIDGVGPLTETLKWGEPAYLTQASRSGSTIRIGWKKSSPTQYALYFNCKTNLVDTFRTLFPELTFQGDRALFFDEKEKLPVNSVATCIELALTYHLNKKAGRSRR